MTGTAAAPAAAAPAAAAPAAPAQGVDASVDTRQTAATGEQRPGAATAGQNGTAAIENQSIAPDNPAGKRPGKNALNPPPENRGVAKQAPDWLPEADKFWDPSNGTVKLREMGESYRELRKRLSMRTDDLQKAMDADRRSRVPAKPSEYQFTPSKEYLDKLTQSGFRGDPAQMVSTDDPMVRMLATIAHRQGLDQDAFSDMLSHYHFTKASTRPDPRVEASKLGENSRERAGAVRMYLEHNLGKEDTQYLISAAGGPTARFVQIIERLMETGGGRSFMPPGAGSTPGAGPMPTKQDLQKLMMSDAYNNQRHPDHAAVQKQVRDGFARIGGGRQVATAPVNPRVRAA